MLDMFAEQFKVTVQHKHYEPISGQLSGSEYTIDNLSVDGYISEQKTILEFHGDFWHGNPVVYSSEDVNPRNHKTFGELYRDTIARMDKFVSFGYRVLYIWESDFRLWNKHGFFAEMPIHEHTVSTHT
jgi:G:T-mismatch repair DNA endonuclease (very short patch repair protein)